MSLLVTALVALCALNVVLKSADAKYSSSSSSAASARPKFYQCHSPSHSHSPSQAATNLSPSSPPPPQQDKQPPKSEPTCRLNTSLDESTGVSHGSCQITCELGNIWPRPSDDIMVGSDVSAVDINRVSCEYSGGSDQTQLRSLQEGACANFIDSLKYYIPSESSSSNLQKKSSSSKGKNVVVAFDFQSNVYEASVDHDESYSAVISSDGNSVFVKVSGATFYGARHGLETASQLFRWDDLQESVIVASSAAVSDKPAFKYRGVMIDTSRQFISVNKIKETIRAMGYNKLNVLHWHLTDTASFPIYISEMPNMTYNGAYSAGQIYDEASVADLVAYANVNGVMVIPEIDAPAHMAMGWSGHDESLGELVLCADNDGNGGEQWGVDALEPPSGQFNVVNENAYKVLEKVYKGVVSSFSKKAGYFHLGGDEVIVGG